MTKTPNPMIGFRLPPAMKKQLEDLAYTNRTTVSALVLEAVRDRLSKEDEL